MNKISKIILSTMLLATPALADTSQPTLQSSLSQETIVQEDANSRVIQVNYQGSDALAIGDPIAGSSMNAMHDAGPPSTHHSYEPGCQLDTCIRAEKRWGMPTTWQHDRATGLSLGWGR